VVEYGAGDGVFLSNSVFFEREVCWTSVNVEPTYLFEELIQNRPGAHNIKGAVCDRVRCARS